MDSSIKSATETCELCNSNLSPSVWQSHNSSCALELKTKAEQSQDPYSAWKSAIAFDRANDFGNSESLFIRAAQLFFDLGTRAPQISKALFEYSTLMDAFADIQRGRSLKATSKFEESLDSFTRASNIFRSTLHFGFLASYTSACATLEVTAELSSSDDDCFQSYKNAIALLEQSKLTLSFRDESHPLITLIESLLKLSMSNALRVESEILLRVGSVEESKKKKWQSELLEKEYQTLSSKGEWNHGAIDYFPLRDWKRVEQGAFVVAYPDSENIWLLNLGTNPATVEALGSVSVGLTLPPKSSLLQPFKDQKKGKIRVTYSDLKTKTSFNEGCLSLI